MGGFDMGALLKMGYKGEELVNDSRFTLSDLRDGVRYTLTNDQLRDEGRGLTAKYIVDKRQCQLAMLKDEAGFEVCDFGTEDFCVHDLHRAGFSGHELEAG